MRMQDESVLSHFALAVVLAREGVLCELLYADDLVLIYKTITGLVDKFRKLKVFENRV